MNTSSWLRAMLYLLATSVALLALSQPALAEGCMHGQHGKHQMPVYSDLDANGDNKVTAEEFYKFRASRMEKRAAEGRKMKNAKNAPAFEDLDLDGDGSLSDEEFSKHHAQCPMRHKKPAAEDQ